MLKLNIIIEDLFGWFRFRRIGSAVLSVDALLEYNGKMATAAPRRTVNRLFATASVSNTFSIEYNSAEGLGQIVSGSVFRDRRLPGKHTRSDHS
jgi:hypothetical protein